MSGKSRLTGLSFGIVRKHTGSFAPYVQLKRQPGNERFVFWLGSYPRRKEAELAVGVAKAEMLLLIEGQEKMRRAMSVMDLPVVYYQEVNRRV